MQLPFWSSDSLKSKKGCAIATQDSVFSFSDLDVMVEDYSTLLANSSFKNQLAFLPMKLDVLSIVRYLACLRMSITPLLLPPDMEQESLNNLKKTYQPLIFFDSNESNIINVDQDQMSKPRLPSNLCILLSTSGSTGSAKLVKLSKANLQANAESISKYLKIGSNQKAHCSLPLSYSFGLSILNSYLHSGSCIYLSELNPLSPDYFKELKRENITSISGVPFFYQMLFRTGFLENEFPALKAMTQAGGKLNNTLIEKFNTYAIKNNINFYVMYGQTEATARISYVPPKLLANKIGSIGIAIPNGKLSLSDGELIYSGPNVMLGYAENIEDLFKKSPVIEKLFTGDTAVKDEDGFYYITGRLKRFIKMAGSRFGLDEIESFLENKYDAVFVVTGIDDKLFIASEPIGVDEFKIKESLQAKFGINRAFIKVNFIHQAIRKPNGKKDYAYYMEKIDE